MASYGDVFDWKVKEYAKVGTLDDIEAPDSAPVGPASEE